MISDYRSDGHSDGEAAPQRSGHNEDTAQGIFGPPDSFLEQILLYLRGLIQGRENEVRHSSRIRKPIVVCLPTAVGVRDDRPGFFGCVVNVFPLPYLVFASRDGVNVFFLCFSFPHHRITHEYIGDCTHSGCRGQF